MVGLALPFFADAREAADFLDAAVDLAGLSLLLAGDAVAAEVDFFSRESMCRLRLTGFSSSVRSIGRFC